MSGSIENFYDIHIFRKFFSKELSSTKMYDMMLHDYF